MMVISMFYFLAAQAQEINCERTQHKGADGECINNTCTQDKHNTDMIDWTDEMRANTNWEEITLPDTFTTGDEQVVK